MTDTSSPLSPPPEVAPPDDSPLRPSSKWYWVAGILAIGGIVGAIVFSVVTFVDAIDSVDDWPRVSVPGTEEVVLSSGSHTLFLEYPGAAEYYSFVDPPDVEITDPDGDAVVIMPTDYRSESYSWGGHSGVSFARFHADTDGLYEVTVRSEPRSTQEVAIGKGIDGRIVLAIFGGMGIGGLSVLIAAIIAIVTGVRRGKEKRRRNPPPVWNPPPPGAYGQAAWGAPYPGAYPQPGWGPPGPAPYGQPQAWGAPPQPGWGASPQPGWGAPPPPSAYPQGSAFPPPPPAPAPVGQPPATPAPDGPTSEAGPPGAS